MLLSEALYIKLGYLDAEKVYLGDTLVWPKDSFNKTYEVSQLTSVDDIDTNADYLLATPNGAIITDEPSFRSYYSTVYYNNKLSGNTLYTNSVVNPLKVRLSKAPSWAGNNTLYMYKDNAQLFSGYNNAIEFTGYDDEYDRYGFNLPIESTYAGLLRGGRHIDPLYKDGFFGTQPQNPDLNDFFRLYKIISE